MHTDESFEAVGILERVALWCCHWRWERHILLIACWDAIHDSLVITLGRNMIFEGRTLAEAEAESKPCQLRSWTGATPAVILDTHDNKLERQQCPQATMARTKGGSKVPNVKLRPAQLHKKPTEGNLFGQYGQ